MLAEDYKKIRERTVSLCNPLKTEDFVPQPAEFTSPPKWHLAHTTWFFEQMILKSFFNGYEEFHPTFGYLFNSYYQHVGERTLRAHRGNMTRPTVEEVLSYRKHVDHFMIELLNDSNDEDLNYLVTLGLNHEQQHQELLLTDLKYTLSLNPLFPMYEQGFNLTDDLNAQDNWVDIQEGIYTIGHDGKGFCFDNECNSHQVFLHDFSIANRLVTNSEYLEFINDGGYERFELWHDEGWSWTQSEGIKHPLYWQLQDGTWLHYSLAGLSPLNSDAVLAHISYYEASAFAHWKGMRLPTEFEWEVASEHLEWGKRWEWTNSAYLPYPGFKTAKGAVGEYNGKFMINQMVLRGGSRATANNHTRKTYRNFFHPHFQWQYSGIRLAK